MSETHSVYRAGQEREPLKVGDRVRVEGVVTNIGHWSAAIRLETGDFVFISLPTANRLPKIQEVQE